MVWYWFIHCSGTPILAKHSLTCAYSFKKLKFMNVLELRTCLLSQISDMLTTISINYFKISTTRFNIFNDVWLGICDKNTTKHEANE